MVLLESGTGGKHRLQRRYWLRNGGDTYSFGSAGSKSGLWRPVSGSVTPSIGLNFKTETQQHHGVMVGYTGDAGDLEQAIVSINSISSTVLMRLLELRNLDRFQYTRLCRTESSCSAGALDGNATANRSTLHIFYWPEHTCRSYFLGSLVRFQRFLAPMTGLRSTISQSRQRAGDTTPPTVSSITMEMRTT